MSNEFIDLSKYRLEKAKEDLGNASVDMESGYIKGSINRSYYAIFHAMRAVHALEGFDSKKHSGVIAHFNQCYINTERLGKEKGLAEIVKKLSKIRNQSDYDDFFVVDKNEAEAQIENAKKFVAEIETYLKPLLKAGDYNE